MTMRDYRNLAWKNQQPWERNPNPPRSMRDYRDQWMSAPVYSVPSNNAPPISPHFTSTPQPPQLPTPSPVEQAILNLSKQVDNFIEEQRGVTVHANKEIDTVESSLNKKIDGLQSEMELKLDNLQCSIFKLANQLVHQEEENLEGEWLPDQEEVMQELVEALEELLTGEAGGGRGKEAGEEPQEPILQQIPMNLNPTATAQATKNPLPVYILPLHAAQPIPKAPTKKSNPSLPMLKNFKRLVAIVQNFVTTSKKMAAAHIAWHSGWFGCRFGFGASEPRDF